MNSTHMTSKFRALCLIAALAVTSITSIARADEEKKNAETFESLLITESCVLKITWEESSSSLNMEVIEALLQSSGVWGTALKESFGEDLSRVHGDVAITLNPLNLDRLKLGQGESITTLAAQLIIKVKGDSTRTIGSNAKPLLKRACDLLEKSIMAFAESTIRTQHERRAQFEEELNRARTQVHKIVTERRAFLERHQASELSHERLAREMRGLEDQLAAMQMNRSVSRARRDAMQEQIANLSEKAKAEPIKRTDLEQLRKIVTIRQEALKVGEAHVNTGHATPNELNNLRIEVAQAAAELARAETEAQRDHARRMHEMGGGFIVEMNHELTKMAIDDADMEAKYKATVERMEKTKAGLKVAEEYEQLGGHRLDIARDRLEMVQRNLADIERRISTSIRPTMTVVGVD
ncbi:MAG: hypothetical protein DHS20C16_06040 [Phycisphaerae bacterium]|nr:MAG: hypothetical protein DHS20C16_06040 [Phycisphaerae bacterium]